LETPKNGRGGPRPLKMCKSGFYGEPRGGDFQNRGKKGGFKSGLEIRRGFPQGF
jgi:hypothetical protein